MEHPQAVRILPSQVKIELAALSQLRWRVKYLFPMAVFASPNLS